MATSKQALLKQIVASLIKIRSHIIRSFEVKKQDKITTTLQYLVLVSVDSQPKQTVGILASEMNMSSSAIAQLIDRLVEAGFIMRENDTDDRRIIHLSLTKSGKTHLERLNSIFSTKAFGIFSKLSEEELHQLLRILGKILASSNEQE